MHRALFLAAALFQAAIPLPIYGGGGASFLRSDAVTTVTPVVPAPYAFAIWGPIFLLSLVVAARVARSDPPALRSITGPLAYAFAANGVWMLAAARNLPMPLLAGILAVAALASAVALRRSTGRTSATWDTQLLVGLLSGWTAFAVFANVSAALERAGVGSLPVSPSAQAILVLAAATLVAASVPGRRPAPVFTGAILWALAGVAIRNVAIAPNAVVAAVAALAAAVMLAREWAARRPSLNPPPL